MAGKWIKNKGKLPITKGALVDVTYRDGRINNHVIAGQDFCDTGSDSARNARDWTIDHVSQDIMKWRLHQPQKQ
jgi:hypothetical protein